MSEMYVAARDAQITVSTLTYGGDETLPVYLTGSRPETVTSSGPRKTGGMSAEQFDRIFPLWAAKYPGRVAVAQ